MDIIAADDEEFMLELLTDAIEEAVPDAGIHGFRKASEVLEFARVTPCDIAFLDIQMRGMDGLELAKRLKESNPKVNIIFVTGCEQYTGDAMRMHASGYITKPVTKRKVEVEMENLRHPVAMEPKHRIRVQCFGNFAVYDCGKILQFKRNKAQEIFAYLVHKRGTTCCMQEIAAALFEDKPYDIQCRNYVRKLVNEMLHTFLDVGVKDLFDKEYNKITLRTDRIDCDYYRFLNLDLSAINAYTGEYMNQYGWAMFVVGYLDDRMS